MAAVTSPETTPQPRVYFQTPPGTEEEVPQKQGRVTVKYDRKELRRRLNLEEWIVSQLMNLYDCEEDEVPELEIDVDELLDLPSDVERAIRVKMLLVDCYKPNDVSAIFNINRIRNYLHYRQSCYSQIHSFTHYDGQKCAFSCLNSNPATCRTLWRHCWRRSEGCRNSTPRRRKGS
ncbi:protein phosphatase 1, regulatory (inhibitor) subunit 14Ba isoform X1 [Chanodichthys erythropterus]|uniref:protein phosphatase 1, regulatory (inhibitor) subunit 14Ba isoform X1 n=1 Tax=Chanodichthys erythropterus TaxID=933992 RepID=UPI00351E9B4B